MPAQNDKADPKPLRLLVIEDNDDDRELLLRQIKKANIEEHVIFTGSGLEGIDVIVRDVARTIFAVFLDLKLREADGLAVLRSIRSGPASMHLPVVVMTGSSDPADLAECRRLKVTAFLGKPIAFEAFCKAVAGLFHLPPQI